MAFMTSNDPSRHYDSKNKDSMTTSVTACIGLNEVGTLHYGELFRMQVLSDERFPVIP